MLRIALVHAHVGGRAGGGGGVRLMLDLALALGRMGHEVTIVCHDFEPGTEHGSVSQEIEVRSVRRGEVDLPTDRLGQIKRLWAGMPRVARLVPRDVDVINAHEWPGLRAGRLAAARCNVPLVWTRNDETIFERAVMPGETVYGSHHIAGRLARGLVGLPDLRDARRAAAIVVLDARNERMVRRCYRRPATIVRSGPSVHFFDPPARSVARERLGVGGGVFLALGVGVLFPHRRFEDLIEAVALLPDDGSIRVRIVGSDHADPRYADRLEALIGKLGVGDRIELRRSGIPEDELRYAYAGADVFVFPNDRQTWGLAPLEAIASGTPVIVSSGAGVHEVLEGKAGAVIVPPRRPDAIARALQGMRAAGGGAGQDLQGTREWIRTELSAERYAERMAGLFTAACASRAARQRRSKKD